MGELSAATVRGRSTLVLGAGAPYHATIQMWVLREVLE